MTNPHELDFNPYAAPRAELSTPDVPMIAPREAALARRLNATFADVLIAVCCVLVVMTIYWFAIVFIDPQSSLRRDGSPPWHTYATEWLSTLFGLILLPAFCESLGKGESIGKGAVKLKVVGRDDGRIGFFRALARTLIKWCLPLTLLSIVLMLCDPQRRAVHDRICGTRVVEA